MSKPGEDKFPEIRKGRNLGRNKPHKVVFNSTSKGHTYIFFASLGSKAIPVSF